MREEELSYFKGRRTVRSYEDRDVSKEMVEEMLAAAMQAPTTGNMQLYSVVETRDAGRRVELAKCHFNQPAATGAPVLLTFCADFNRFEKWCRLRGAEPGFENFQSFVAAMLDATILAQQFNTIAEMRGLGCCYLGTTTYMADRIAEVLELPDRVVPIVTLSVGWPAGDSVVSDRIPVKGILHSERYGDYSDDEISALYCEKEAREDSKRFVEENGKCSLAQVFTDVRYPRGTNEAFSKVFLDFIKSRSFLN